MELASYFSPSLSELGFAVAAEAMLTSSYASMEAANAAGLETDVRKEDFETAKAAVSQANAALDDAKLQLSYTVITAPVSGRIG